MNSSLPDAACVPQKLRDLERRARAVLGHELVRHPAAGALRNLGQSASANIRQIQALAETAGAGDEIDDERPVAAAKLMETSHQLLDKVVDQIALCDSTARHAAVTAGWARRLMAQERLNYHEMLPLSGRMLDEVDTISCLGRVMPIPGLSLSSLVASSTGDADSALFVGGITAARVLIWALRDDPRRTERLPVLVLAALLQDAGRMLECGGSPKRRLYAKRVEWFQQHHPAVGAALLGAIRGAPVLLALTVGQHHERLDGRGFPRMLLAREIFPEAALVAAASRFSELCLELESEPYCEIAGDNVLARTAQALLSEAEAGSWHIEFAQRLSQQISATEPGDQPVPADVRHSPGARALEPDEVDLDGPNAGNHILHDEERSLRGTHVEPEGRFVATTLDEIRMTPPQGSRRFRGRQ